jgi:phosphatidate phosphatase APP1
MRNFLYKFISACVALTSLPLWASPIKDDEFIQLMSSAAKLTDSGEVHLNVTAWVYEKETRPGAKSALALWMKMDTDDLSLEEQERFEKRTQLFRIDSERNKKLVLQFSNGQKEKLSSTNASGISAKKIQLTQDKNLQHGNQLQYKAILPEKDKREFIGNMVLVSETGVSIISDIDDTIKDSHVLDKQLLIRNTFVNPLHAVAGMSDLYQAYLSADKQLAFHYVSSSPIQLFPLLTEFLQQEKFPAGSLHLRQIKLKDELFKEGSSSQRHKHKQIRGLLKQFPNRQFILIGDSGEADPEIYADVIRDFPDRILHIFIRDVTREAVSSPRYQQTFKSIPAGKWRIFTEPKELAGIL